MKNVKYGPTCGRCVDRNVYNVYRRTPVSAVDLGPEKKKRKIKGMNGS